MGKLFDLLQAAAGESSLRSLLGRWRQEVSQEVDETSARVAEIEQVAAGEVTALAGPGLVPDGTELAVGQNPDNSIIVNADDVQVNLAIQAGAAAGATALQIAGAGLTESPAGTVNVGANADASILVHADDIQLNPAFGLSPTGGTVFLTQTDWAVNPQTGNDANPGNTAAPLQTLAELERRWSGQTFSPAVAAVTVTLSGTFTVTDSLVLAGATFTGPGTILVINGTMSTSDSGSITAYTAMSPSTGVRATLTDAAQDFTPSLKRRIRMTSGAQNGALTWVMSLGGGTTVANIGQFFTIGNFSGTNVNPAPGDTYVIETYTTVLQRYMIDLAGPVSTLIKDIRFEAQPIVTDVTYSGFSQQVDRLKNRLAGCQFNLAGFSVYLLFGNQALIACGITGDTATNAGFQFKNGSFGENGCCWFTGSQMLAGANVEGQHNMHDGGGTLGVCRIVQNLSQMEDFNHRGFFGNINGAAPQHVQLNDGGIWIMSASTARFWGAAGNTVTTPLRILNGSYFLYTSTAPPTATGVTPGNDLVLANAAAISWATLPAAAAPPNSAYADVRQ